jgi:hypothetical protein
MCFSTTVFGGIAWWLANWGVRSWLNLVNRMVLVIDLGERMDPEMHQQFAIIAAQHRLDEKAVSAVVCQQTAVKLFQNDNARVLGRFWLACNSRHARESYA